MNERPQRTQELNRMHLIRLFIFAILCVLFIPSVSAQSCVSAPSSMVSWWAGDDDATDRTGNNSGSIVGGVSFLQGEVADCFNFDGTSGYIFVPASSSTDVGNLGTGMTLECWINISTLTDMLPLVEWNNGISPGVHWWVNEGLSSTGRAAIYINFVSTAGLNNNFWSSDGVITTNVWQHLAVTYSPSSGTGVIYYNGKSVTTHSMGTFTPQTTYDLYLGRRPSSQGPAFFQGQMDEVGIYSRALSATEILGIYQAGPGGKCQTGSPIITAQPTNSVFGVSSNGIFSVGASGSLPLSYQWLFNGTNLPGATNYSITFTNLQFSNDGVFSVVITNAFGSVTSAAAILTVLIFPPVITTQPASQTNYTSGTALFSVSNSGVPPFTYQWFFNSNTLANATNNTLLLTNLQVSQAGAYSVAVSNSGGVALSSNAILTVITPPPCTTAPSNLVGWWKGDGNYWDSYGGNNGNSTNVTFVPSEVGQAFVLNGSNGYVNLGRSPNLQLQNFTIEMWIRRSSSSVISSSSPIAMLLSYGNGGYALGMYGDGRIFLSRADVDSISVSPGLTDTNSFHHVAMTKTNTSVIMYVDGVSYPAPSYGSTFTFTTPVAIGADGDDHLNPFFGAIDELSVYSRVLSSNEIQAIYSAGAGGKCALSVSPSIYLQPTNQTTVPSNTVTLNVAAIGSSFLGFQWLQNGTIVAGATNNSLTFSNIQPSSAGNYTVLISNVFGSVTSATATVKVVLMTVLGNGIVVTNSPTSYSGSVSIQLRNFYTNGYIFYTLDGTTPTPFSAVYSGPMVLSNNAVIRTLAFSVDFLQYGYSDPVTIQIVPSYTLVASTAGGGTISLSPANPTNTYVSNAVVNLTANPASGWTFLEWQGDAGGGSLTNSLVMTRNKSVQAIFGTTVTNSAGGNGSVVFNPPGFVYPYGFNLQASAVPQAGNVFVLWGNAASGNTNPLSFLVTNANTEISALFTAISGGQMALTVVPVGHGRVSVSPRANQYSTGATVTITATPDAGKSFLGWSGNASGTQNPLSVVMNQNKLIYANFSTNGSLSLTLGSGPGTSQGVEVDLMGEIGTHYRLDGSTDFTNWTTLYNLTNGVGILRYIDLTASNQNRKFYRAVILP